jgi:hypothetical protein
MGCELRAFQANRRVKVYNPIPGSSEQLVDMAKEPKARHVAPFRGCVGEVATDVTQCGRAQQRIANSVRECIAIRVAHRAFLKANAYAAENQFAPGCETMKVIPDPSTEKILNSEL